MHFMTVLSTRWRFDNYTKKGEFYIEKKIMKKFVKLCLHLSYIVQNSFHFDEIFHKKKNHEKIRESLFTFKLHSTELLSF